MWKAAPRDLPRVIRQAAAMFAEISSRSKRRCAPRMAPAFLNMVDCWSRLNRSHWVSIVEQHSFRGEQRSSAF